MGNIKNRLNLYIYGFCRDREQYCKYKKYLEDTSEEIKILMKELNVSEFVTDDGFVVKLTDNENAFNGVSVTFNNEAVYQKKGETNA